MWLLRGGRVLDPARDYDAVADVLVDGSRVVEINPGLAERHPEVPAVDVGGQWVMPGWVDFRARLGEPGMEYRENLASALGAAEAGGFTTVCASAESDPVNDTGSVTEALIAQASARGGTRLVPTGAITHGLAGRELSEMGTLREAGVRVLSDEPRCVMSAALMRRALEYARTFDLLVAQHCEDASLAGASDAHEGGLASRLGLRGGPSAAEHIIVARDLELVRLTGARYHVSHVSSGGTVDLLRAAKGEGLPVSADVSVAHLCFNETAVGAYGTRFKLRPPLRAEADQAALLDGVRDGVIDCISSDHAPLAEYEKRCPFESALPGASTLEAVAPLAVRLTSESALSPLRMVAALSLAPAKLLRAQASGQLDQADITVLDSAHAWRAQHEEPRSRGANPLLAGESVEGQVTLTVVGGRVVHDPRNAYKAAMSEGSGP